MINKLLGLTTREDSVFRRVQGFKPSLPVRSFYLLSKKGLHLSTYIMNKFTLLGSWINTHNILHEVILDPRILQILCSKCGDLSLLLLDSFKGVLFILSTIWHNMFSGLFLLRVLYRHWKNIIVERLFIVVE